MSYVFILKEELFLYWCHKNVTKITSGMSLSRQQNLILSWMSRLQKDEKEKFGWKKTQPWSSPKRRPVTWWPLVVHWRLTQTAQSFPYRRVLPGPAGFDINTRLWLTEALALGWAPGASTVHSALLLACWFTVPGGCSLIHFPSQFAHRAPQKTVLQQYICFMISWGANEEKQVPAHCTCSS